MANNELSGPTLTIYLSKWLKSLKKENIHTELYLYLKLWFNSIISKNLNHI